MLRNIILNSVFLCMALFVSERAFSKEITIYSNPEDAPKGEESFLSVAEAIKSGTVHDGDTIFLTSGYHRKIFIYNKSFENGITISGPEDMSARVPSIALGGESTNITITHLQVIPQNEQDRPKQALVKTSGKSDNIRLSNLYVRPVPDQQWRNWDTAEEWLSNKINGIHTRGANHILENNNISAVYMGITSTGANGLITKNHIDLFSGDGVRVLGNNSTVSQNIIKNCVKIDDNHDDGIQAWSLGSESKRSGEGNLRNVTIDRNTIVQWDRPTPPALRCNLQGIGFFDGIYDNLTISNNLVIVDQWHGISVYGARDSKIINNTVIDLEPSNKPVPWISLPPHKNGRDFGGNIAANNISPNFKLLSASDGPLNITLKYPKLIFINPSAGDYRLRNDSNLSQAKHNKYQPELDHDGNVRPNDRTFPGAFNAADAL